MNLSTHSTKSKAIKPLVVKISGSALDAPAEHQLLWAAIARWHKSLPGGVIVVHGGGKLTDSRLAKLGFQSKKVDGIRMTPPDQIDEIVASLAGVANFRVCNAIRLSGAMPVGLTLADGNSVTAHKKHHPEVDLGLVGEVSGGDPALGVELLSNGFLPVFSSIASDREGAPLNVNADEAAAAIAATFRALELVFLSDVSGVRGEGGRVIGELDRTSSDELINGGVILDGMIAKVRSALDAAECSHCPVRIMSFNDVGNIEVWPPDTPIGTVIRARRTAVETV